MIEYMIIQIWTSYRNEDGADLNERDPTSVASLEVACGQQVSVAGTRQSVNRAELAALVERYAAAQASGRAATT